ncbi:MAG TPA: T9SS type A sorting domain-containing protein [Bacteroidia bacterium]|nr:T9SS type A sorting domain-containing protein [Bacteroidia bacterium]
MKKFLTTILILTCGLCNGQNLVPNPSFEVFDTCPNYLFQVQRAIGWFGANGTADYFNSCFVYPGTGWNVSVPTNWVGYQQAYDGNGYMGMATFIEPDSSTIGIREAIGIQLPTPLVAGTKYFASFYASLTNNAIIYHGCGSNKLGIMFSNTQYLASLTTNVIPLNNQSKVFTDSIILDTLNWIKISGSFISDSNYSYMYVGNFFQDSLVSFIADSVFNGWSHYYVENICLSTDSMTCNSEVGINEVENREQSLLFPNPFTDEINISLKRNELIEVTLFDITSRKILQKKFIKSVSINTEQLAKGIYIYQVRNEKGIIKNGKIIKL